MSNKPVSLKPGLLVALRTSILGGITYMRTDLDAGSAGQVEHVQGCPGGTGGACSELCATNRDVSRWETTRVISDKAEYERAQKARSRAAHLVRSVCTQSAFGLLCSSAREKELDAAIAEAQLLVETFNASAVSSRISIHVLRGQIEASDAAAARAIGAEVRELIDAMRAGIEAADPAAIRAAANRAKEFGQMLDEETAGKVSSAIAEARSAARAIVRRVESGGEEAALVVQELSRKALDEARFAFLDLEESAAPVAQAAAPARQVDASDDEPVEHVTGNSRSFDFGPDPDTVESAGAEGQS